MSNKMNPEIKAQWLAALRSGEYRQGRGELHSSDGKFCCLGVLCDLAVRAGREEVGLMPGGPHYYGDHEQSLLTEGVADWSGLNTVAPAALRADTFVHLDHLNDAGKTFAEIADLIEEHL